MGNCAGVKRDATMEMNQMPGAMSSLLLKKADPKERAQDNMRDRSLASGIWLEARLYCQIKVENAYTVETKFSFGGQEHEWLQVSSRPDLISTPFKFELLYHVPQVINVDMSLNYETEKFGEKGIKRRFQFVIQDAFKGDGS